MDTLLSNSTILYKPQLPLVCSVTFAAPNRSSIATTSSSYCHCSGFTSSAAGFINISFSYSNRAKLASGFRNFSSSVRRVSINCGVTEVSQTQFADMVLKSDRPVLVEFVAKWCGPCRLIAPAVEAIAQEYEEKLMVVKIDHDANPQLIEDYNVYGLPTLILFKNGLEVPESRREGAITKVKLKEYVDGLLKSASVA